ncbi:MAG: translation initiation factor IF-3 [Clostridia bacterium]|nr:translation initiation factor IF-3 [Clostridia bacterium]MDE7328769.1 translation initiation factor IF-3 [Clostridia bacterium]
MLINGQIREKTVRLLDQDGAQLGIMSANEANELAQSKDLDLVLISPTAKPPVCKIMNYGKFKYETIKREKENKKNQHTVELKEVWLSATIDVGDLNTKAKQAQKFIANGDRVRVSIRLRGRQMARPELAMKVMDDFFDILKDIAQMEKKPLLEGKSIAMTLSPIAKK